MQQRHFRKLGTQVSGPCNLRWLWQPFCVLGLNRSRQLQLPGLPLLNELGPFRVRILRTCSFQTTLHHDIVDDETARTAQLEPEPSIGELFRFKCHRLVFWLSIDQVLQQVILLPGASDADAIISSGGISRSSDDANTGGVGSRIIEIQTGPSRRASINEQVSTDDRTVILIVVERDVVADPFGGSAPGKMISHQIKRDLH